MTAASSFPSQTDWRNLAAACSAVVVFGFALGLVFPLLSLVLDARGVPERMIGLNAAMSPLGILTSSVFIPVLARRWGMRRVMLMAALATAAILLAYNVFTSLEAWFVLRFLQGVTVSTLFVLSESLLVKSTGGANRGKIVAFYAAALSASFGAGPALIGVIGIEGWAPYAIGAATLVVAMVPMALIRDDAAGAADDGAGWSDIARFVPRAPVLLAAILAFAVFDAATLSLIPIYGLRTGLDLATSANVLTALIVGNVVLQFPIGWLADRIDRRVLLAALAAVTTVLLMVLPYTMAGLWKWPVLLIMGATGYGVYTVALALLGDRFTGRDLVAGAAAFAMMFGIGALAGSVLGGWAMDRFGPHGLPRVLAACFVVFLAAMWARRAQRRRNGIEGGLL